MESNHLSNGVELQAPPAAPDNGFPGINGTGPSEPSGAPAYRVEQPQQQEQPAPAQPAHPQQPVAVDPYSRNLGRGKACEACRRRKLRCDGARPSCSRCVEARNRKLDALRRKGLSEEEVNAVVFPPCYTEGDNEGETSMASQVEPAPGTAAYDDRNNIFAVGAAQASTSAAGAQQGATAQNGSAPRKRRRGPRATAESHNQTDTELPLPNDLYFAEILSSHLPLESSTRANGQNGADSIPRTIAFEPYRGHIDLAAKEPTPIARAEAATSLTMAYHLAQPDIPLPPADKMMELLDVAYKEMPMMSIFHPGRLRERLALGHEHADYPHAAALHIIAALAYAARPELDDGPSVPTTRSGAHYRHTMATRHHISTCIHMGSSGRAFDVARAALLLVFKLYGMGDQMESYLAKSNAVRLAVSLNLNRESSTQADPENPLSQFTLLQPRITDGSTMSVNARDEIDAEEARRTMLLVFVVDRTSIAATLWPGSISEEDYTAELPRATVQEFLSTTTDNLDMQAWTARRNKLSLQSSDFFSSPAGDPEQFLYKGAVLLGRCALYVSRMPRSSTTEYITSSSRFQQLESWIAALHLESSDMAKSAAAVRGASGSSTSSHSGSPPQQPARKAEGALAAYLLAASGEATVYKGLIIGSALMPYACTLTLHEPLAGLTSESEAMCRAATRGVISVLRLCAVHAETEMSRLDVALTLIVMLVGRSLIRQLESLYSKYIAQEIAQQSTQTGSGPKSERDVWSSEEFTESVSLLQADLEVIMLTLKRFGQKWYMATKLHEALLKLLQFNPEHRLRGLFCVE